MTTAKEQFSNDLHKKPEDLEREADGVRDDLEGTVDQLMHQLSPTYLIDQGISFVRDHGYYDYVRKIASQVENNPVPTVLVGVGLIWLMSASRQPSTNQGGGFTDTMGKKAGATGEKLSSATSSLKSSTHDAAERTRETGQNMASGASDVMHRIGDASRHTAESARTGLSNAREGYTDMLREQPLMVGVLAVAAGAALGALLPRTSAEDRVIGEWSDRGTDALKEKTEEKTDALKERAEEKLQEVQSKDSPESDDRPEASASSTPSPTTTPKKPASGTSGGEESRTATDSGQSCPVPPKLDPASTGAGRDSSKPRPGNNV